ncbi:hypothetical protein XO10_05865 [Marinitoga sp. 1135]|uniref:hypothetical protein n=1 Tax=Marinitoga sp. 1135 TaxID=1643333 RepID=UPI001586ADD3|nr:hypothetical protein [Marinitoga sp. 1135]NUU95807.1 hypothetical protein [Marinitoga sp. 1135]
MKLEINTREQLYEIINEKMVKSLKGRRYENLESAIPKVYVLETSSNLNENIFFDYMKKEFVNRMDANLSYFDDNELIEIKIGDTYFYADPYLFYDLENARFRFVPIFTLAHSQVSDSIIGSLIKKSFFFDYQWLDFNESDDEYDEFIVGISSSFPGELIANEENVSFSLESNSSKAFINNYKKIVKQLPLNKVKIKYFLSNPESTHIIAYNNGKITFYGNDFEEVKEFFKVKTKKYSDELFEIEKLAYDYEGVYIIFDKEKKLKEKPENFLKRLNDNNELKVVSFQIFSDEDEAYGVFSDMHVGGSLAINVYRFGLQILIRPGTCSNTVKRILNFIRKNYDPLCKLYISEKEVFNILDYDYKYE